MTGPDFANGGLSNASNNGGVGNSEVGLRGLGPTRTLVLIDGQRLIPIFSGAASVPDLNSVPLAMVDRIEVLRDGASSIYGADAVGGVINIITKKHADGMTIDGFGGHQRAWRRHDLQRHRHVGMNSDRGNLMLGVGWDHRDPVDSSRDWAIDPHIGAACAKAVRPTARSSTCCRTRTRTPRLGRRQVQYDLARSRLVATLAPQPASSCRTSAG